MSFYITNVLHLTHVLPTLLLLVNYGIRVDSNNKGCKWWKSFLNLHVQHLCRLVKCLWNPHMNIITYSTLKKVFLHW